MKLLRVSVWLVLCVSGARGVFFNFLSRYMTFFRSTALLEDWQLAVPVAALLLFSTMVAGQYGYLPLKPEVVASRLQQLRASLRGRHGRPGRYRRALYTEHTLERLLTALQLMENTLGNGHKFGTDTHNTV